MANLTFTISFDLSYLIDLIGRISERERGGLYERVRTAVDDGADLLMANWADEAQTALHGSKGGYVNSIGKAYPIETSSIAHVQVYSNHPAAVYLEHGIASFDMKGMLQTSSKVKISEKTGKRYMHIPFEHTREELLKSGVDPREISDMSHSTRDPRHWGDKLTDFGNVGKRTKYFTARKSLRDLHSQKVSEGMSSKIVSYEWKTSKFENTYRFKDTRTNQTSGFKSFRTISENSDPMSWIHPGIRAMNIAGNAVEKTKPVFYQSITNLVETTLRETGLPVSA